jgi:hypothetical protein
VVGTCIIRLREHLIFATSFFLSSKHYPISDIFFAYGICSRSFDPKIHTMNLHSRKMSDVDDSENKNNTMMQDKPSELRGWQRMLDKHHHYKRSILHTDLLRRHMDMPFTADAHFMLPYQTIQLLTNMFSFDHMKKIYSIPKKSKIHMEQESQWIHEIRGFHVLHGINEYTKNVDIRLLNEINNENSCTLAEYINKSTGTESNKHANYFKHGKVSQSPTLCKILQNFRPAQLSDYDLFRFQSHSYQSMQGISVFYQFFSFFLHYRSLSYYKNEF